MSSLNYLAYGSNLFTPRLTARITIRSVVATVVLPGYGLRFNKRGADGSGKCQLQACVDELAYGVVYRIDSADKTTLDRIEGVGHGYELALWHDQSLGECFFYRAQATAVDNSLLPFDWYHAYVLAGARQHGLPATYLAAIAAVATREDHNAQRRAENFSRLATAFPDIMPGQG